MSARPLDVGAVLEELRHDVGVSSKRSGLKRVAELPALRVDVGAVLEELGVPFGRVQ